ncbi:MAG: molybdopterin-binding protein [Parvularcula sp.]|jgi:molybdenum cofactor synthesis domain-containing protein|nr:molybdopterin-binding protein [Parvularcula sp.]
MTSQIPSTASCLLIGDELLSGRTRDSNAHHLAKRLHAHGVELLEVRIVPDDEKRIVDAVRELSRLTDTVFTSGGIGPTHDDITAEAVAKALGAPIGERADALEILREHYAAKGEEVTDARRRMARIPDGAELIPNAISGAPGFRLGQVYVLAGVPAIFEAMLEEVMKSLPRGAAETIVSITGELPESRLADGLADLQAALKGLKVGSYPGKTGRGGPLTILCRSRHAPTAEQAARAVHSMFLAQGVKAEIREGFGDDAEAKRD